MSEIWTMYKKANASLHKQGFVLGSILGATAALGGASLIRPLRRWATKKVSNSLFSGEMAQRIELEDAAAVVAKQFRDVDHTDTLAALKTLLPRKTNAKKAVLDAEKNLAATPPPTPIPQMPTLTGNTAKDKQATAAHGVELEQHTAASAPYHAAQAALDKAKTELAHLDLEQARLPTPRGGSPAHVAEAAAPEAAAVADDTHDVLKEFNLSRDKRKNNTIAAMIQRNPYTAMALGGTAAAGMAIPAGVGAGVVGSTLSNRHMSKQSNETTRGVDIMNKIAFMEGYMSKTAGDGKTNAVAFLYNLFSKKPASAQTVHRLLSSGPNASMSLADLKTMASRPGSSADLKHFLAGLENSLDPKDAAKYLQKLQSIVPDKLAKHLSRTPDSTFNASLSSGNKYMDKRLADTGAANNLTTAKMLGLAGAGAGVGAIGGLGAGVASGMALRN